MAEVLMTGVLRTGDQKEPLRPASPGELAELLRLHAESREPLAPAGSGSKAGLGRPVRHRRLDLSAFAGITAYEPEELVLTAGAATPLAGIEALLADRGQELAFEPLRLAALYGGGDGTLGGAMMTNLAGPRRIKAGAVRDHILGVAAVSGRGEIFKAGGRVVKNVTGYDLPRGLCGSFGTLAVVTEVTVKVLPRAETEATVLLSGLDDAAAIRALCAAMGLPVDVSGAAHLPAAAARALGLDQAATIARIEGVGPSVAARAERLAAAWKGSGPVERLDAAASRKLWSAVRAVEPLAGCETHALWKLSVAPSRGAAVAAAVRPDRHFYDWSGGLLWLAVRATGDAGAATLRAAIAEGGGGHATLMRAPDALRAAVPVFQPEAPAVAAVAARLKAEFDPAGILNPGRL